MFKEWDRVVVNEPDTDIVNVKGTVICAREGRFQQLCDVILDDMVATWDSLERCFLQEELTIITNKES